MDTWEKAIIALATGGGLALPTAVISKLMEIPTTRKANEIAAARLELETRDAERKDRQAAATSEQSRLSERTADADRYRRMLGEEENAHEETRRELEAMRLKCRQMETKGS